MWSADLSPDGSRIVSVGQDGALLEWVSNPNGTTNRSNGYRCSKVNDDSEEDCIYSVSWGKINNLVSTCSAGGYIRIFELGAQGSGEVTRVANSHGYFEVNCVKWCPHNEENCGNLLVSGGDDHVVRLWRFNRNK